MQKNPRKDRPNVQPARKLPLVRWITLLSAFVVGVAAFTGALTDIYDFAVRLFSSEPAKNISSKKTVSRTLPRPSVAWPNTGDSRTDAVFTQLNTIEKRGTATVFELTSPVHQFFQRPVFIDIQEEALPSAAYVFCHGERLLEHYQPFFRQQPTADAAINTAKTRLVKLQQLISQACGPDLVENTFRSRETKKAQFEGGLACANLQNLDVEKANEALSKLREALQAAGL
jgi:hypothetical protein